MKTYKYIYIPKLNYKNVIITTKNGMIKRSKLKEFRLQRYNKATSCMKLKDNDETSQIIKSAIECGYRLIDTASAYQNEKYQEIIDNFTKTNK